MSFFLVVKAELVRVFIMMRRYWFRTVIGMVISYGILILLIVGFVNRPDSFDVSDKIANAEDATRWALGFIIGMFAFGVVGMFSQGLQVMAQNGQLEQLCMSPHGLVTNFLARSFVAAISNIVTSAILITLIAKTFGGVLHADFGPTVILLALTFANLIGFGFMVGGLVLVFKQIGQVVVIVRMAMFALAIAAEKIAAAPSALVRGLAHALPITDAAICIKYVLVEGQTMDGAFTSVFVHNSFYFLIANCAFWTVVGITCFRLMEDWSRSKGTLGAY